ncbi:hypothetical protein IWX90DRAFT_488751 [Phyllosticta citrichinensis]|uniref:Uncharacterized protein n=1 Tax=Phyllosticta citrichinensis TaxID=1130410 RepID=A0ABR1XKJ3_9PEZI
MKIKPKEREEALRRLRRIGIDNLIDASIKPRQPLDPSVRKKKVMLAQDDTPAIPPEEYDGTLLVGLDELVRAVNDHAQVKQLLLSKVQSRHDHKHHFQKNVREILASDVVNILRAQQPSHANVPAKKCTLKRPAKTAPSPRQLRPRKVARTLERLQFDDSEEEHANNQSRSEGSQEHIDAPDAHNILEEYYDGEADEEIADQPGAHDGGQEATVKQRVQGEAARVTVFYPSREMTDALDDDTSFSIRDVLSLANSADDVAPISVANTRINVKVLSVQPDAAAADAAYEKTEQLVRSLTHLDAFVPMAEVVMKVPTRKLPEVHLMAATSVASDNARQAMHQATSMDEVNDAEIKKATEAYADYERAEFEWRRNIMARLAQLQLNNAHATSGLVLSPKLKELFESVLL